MRFIEAVGTAVLVLAAGGAGLLSVSPFVSAPGGEYVVNGTSFTKQNGVKPWSFAATGVQQRFEIESGDRWSGDPATTERSELVGPTTPNPYAAPIWWGYSFMIQTVGAETGEWTAVGQMHDNGDIPGRSPWLDGELDGGDFVIYSRFTTSTGSGTPVERARVALVPFEWNSIVWNFLASGVSGGGMLKVWMNGEQIVNCDPCDIGFAFDGAGSYPKIGIYRGTGGQVLAPITIVTANVGQYGTADLSGLVSNPTPVN